ncbi:interleukin-8-like [Myripristis murdjan]|uniref:interleukin-8-like n=1 Tax=Myripristis murdjan TaxID=586833 RepID=UPI001175E23F|nr:interleukin-8-like [Myripristis murdjan]
MSTITAVALLAFLTITVGLGLGEQGMNLRCRCISKERKPIGRHIEKLEVIPANSHCEEVEIIATLKGSGLLVCLDPNVPWVKRVLEKTLAGTNP